MRGVSTRRKWLAALFLVVVLPLRPAPTPQNPRDRDLRSRIRQWVVTIQCKLGTPGCTSDGGLYPKK